jgi:hypothetical protein
MTDLVKSRVSLINSPIDPVLSRTNRSFCPSVLRGAEEEVPIFSTEG